MSGNKQSIENATEILDIAIALFTAAKYRLPRLVCKAYISRWDKCYF
jgi:hypothetical protein